MYLYDVVLQYRDGCCMYPSLIMSNFCMNVVSSLSIGKNVGSYKTLFEIILQVNFIMITYTFKNNTNNIKDTSSNTFK